MSGSTARAKPLPISRRFHRFHPTSTGISGSVPRHSTTYNPEYLKSCLSWNRFWDFGTGQIGDMGSHLIDLPYWALGLRFPTTCEAEGKPLHPDSYPGQIKVTWDHPATDGAAGRESALV